ncbi:uncharacterized protein SCODWIG_03143 [Saccharomycodes ludwigii]|uniref:Lunapark zinc ribbon domain-containing protein n=1 Tax=Saccharomycodes ludwigii TaxID=36035 RepID=A0A376B9Q6_9ASCO|nr:hypothetical protein SCDLUD_004367 [Saccharomycodes ludwigii]KAH3900049.1 hypothetical protein SCDLUD_004367 [Saccharomycodes ludwigii]SSD61382.1 uncharacterized protein SCODWIG_03143 [Saccharomycodes ludwigii]
MGLFFPSNSKKKKKNTNLEKYSLEFEDITNKIEYYTERINKSKANYNFRTFLKLLFTLVVCNIILGFILKYYVSYHYYYYQSFHGYIKLFTIVSDLLILYLYRKSHYHRINKWTKKIIRLRKLHQDKIEDLKNSTSFNSVGALINRYSAGQNGDEDEAKLLDKEVLAKKKQLQELKEELDVLRKQGGGANIASSNKWFDKALSLLSGEENCITDNNSGNMEIVICPICKANSGMFKWKFTTINFICPNCKSESVIKSSLKRLSDGLEDSSNNKDIGTVSNESDTKIKKE